MAYSTVKAVVIGTLFLAFAVRGAEVTPLQKVITLLTDLSAKISEEGNKEAAHYDKFACFCKDQVNEKQHSIEKLTADIKKLNAKEDLLTAQIGTGKAQKGELVAELKNITQTMKDKIKNREKDHNKYLAEAKDIDEAIASSEEAIRNFEAQLAQQKPMQLLQVKSVQRAMEKHPTARGAAAFLSTITEEELTAPNLGYKGTNAVINSLKKFVTEFKEQAKSTWDDEHAAKAAFDRFIMSRTQTKEFNGKSIKERLTMISKKTADKKEAESMELQEETDLRSNSAFLKDLTTQCEDKAKLFDQRSSVRSEELTKLTEAIAELKKGGPKGGTVGVMSELQQPRRTRVLPTLAKKVQIAQHPAAEKTAKATSFLQLSREDAALERVRAFLAKAGSKTESLVLSQLAARIQADHFVKVRSLINDLVKKLEADATSESTQKARCDKGMTAALAGRDDASSRIEAANAEITKLTAAMAQLQKDKQFQLSEAAALTKAKNEYLETYNDEKEDNANTLKVATTGKLAVKKAMDLLSNFYSSNALLVQTKTEYKPPKSDAEGKTVADRAPKVFDSEYQGAQAESKGIIGILEVTFSDFERVERVTQGSMMEAQLAKNKFVSETDTDLAAKKKEAERLQSVWVTKDSDKDDQEDALKDAKALLKLSNKAIENLQTDCIAGSHGEGFEDRKKARLKEIESLKQAQEMLDSFK